MILHIALVHFPIIDKKGACVATSITNLDLHDLSRAATTFGVEAVWLVHPYEAQRRFLTRVMRHWTDGWGAAYNPSRREALGRTEMAADLNETAQRIEALHGQAPLFVGTHARSVRSEISYRAMRTILRENPRTPYCLVFGTGYGLHPEAMEQMDLMLEPIYGAGEWNHLSVRSAVSIILDRLVSDW